MNNSIKLIYYFLILTLLTSCLGFIDSDQESIVQYKNFVSFKLESTYPKNNTLNLPLNTPLLVAFNKPIDQRKFSNENIILKSEYNLEVKLIPAIINDKYILMFPENNQLLKSYTRYYLHIQNIHDTNGNKLEDNIVIMFKTGDKSDIVGPSITKISARQSKINLYFDEFLYPNITTNTIIINDSNNNSIPGKIYYVENEKSIYFIPERPLNSEVKYSINIQPNKIRDLFNNYLSRSFNYYLYPAKDSDNLNLIVNEIKVLTKFSYPVCENNPCIKNRIPEFHIIEVYFNKKIHNYNLYYYKDQSNRINSYTISLENNDTLVELDSLELSSTMQKITIKTRGRLDNIYNYDLVLYKKNLTDMAGNILHNSFLNEYTNKPHYLYYENIDFHNAEPYK